MEIHPIAHYHGPFTSKFGIPRQSGLAADVPGHIVFTPPYRHAEAVRGLEAFDYLWLIWEFSANSSPAADASGSACNSSPARASLCLSTSPSTLPLTVRPPRLGGNERVGVFASRSPFRPNRLGLSCVRIKTVMPSTEQGPVIHVEGADLMDGTPIFDIKPYVAYADAHGDARSGFVDTTAWQSLQVEIPESVAALFKPAELQGLRAALAQDPRPQYHHDPTRIYGMPYAGHDIKFRVANGILTVIPSVV